MISIIITTYNRSKYLCQAVDAILAQSYTDYEVIIADDNSSDDTPIVVKRYLRDPRVKYLKQENNVGPGALRKLAFDKVAGEYVIFHDDDDYYTNNLFFEKAIAILNLYPGVSFVSANVSLDVMESNNKFEKRLGYKGLINNKDFLSNFQTKYEKPQSTFCTVFRVNGLKISGLLDEKIVNDSSIYLYSLLVGNAYILDDVIGCYRIHPGNISRHLSVDFIIDNLKIKRNIYHNAVKCGLLSNPSEWLCDEYFLTYNYFKTYCKSKSELKQIERWCIDNDPFHKISVKFSSQGATVEVIRNFVNNILLNYRKKYDSVVFIQAYLDKVNFGDDMFVLNLCNRYPRTLFICNDYRKHKAFEKIPNLINCSVNNQRIRRNLLGISLNKFVLILKSQCDLIVVIGGSIFIESSNPNTVINMYMSYLSAKKPICVIGCNFGPYKTQYFVNSIDQFLSKCEYVCFRDQFSRNLFSNKRAVVRYAPDILFSEGSVYPKPKKKIISVSMFNLMRDHDVLDCVPILFIEHLGKILEKFIQEGYSIKLLSLCPDQGDTVYCAYVLNILSKSYRDHCSIVEYLGDYLDIKNIIRQSSYLLAMRFHAIVYAINNHTPVYPILYSEKHKYLLDDLNYMGNYSYIKDFHKKSIEEICSNFNYVYDNSKLIVDSQRQYEFLDSYLTPPVENGAKISVIMPVYNAEKFLEQSLLSVLNQDYNNFELICINDGSTDQSGEILKKYSQNPHLVIINQSNQSAAIARNNGIKASTGEYITFIDSDDQMLPKALRFYAKQISLYHSDLIVSKALESFTNGATRVAKWVLKEKYVPNKSIFNLDDYPTGVMLFTAYVPWGKCFKKEFLMKNSIEFPSFRRNEDIYFVQYSCLLAKSISVIWVPSVNHLIDNENSLENKGFEINPLLFWECSKYFRAKACVNKRFHKAIRGIDNADVSRAYFYYNYAKGLTKAKVGKCVKNEIIPVLESIDYPYILSKDQADWLIQMKNSEFE